MLVDLNSELTEEDKDELIKSLRIANENLLRQVFHLRREAGIFRAIKEAVNQDPNLMEELKRFLAIMKLSKPDIEHKEFYNDTTVFNFE